MVVGIKVVRLLAGKNVPLLWLTIARSKAPCALSLCPEPWRLSSCKAESFEKCWKKFPGRPWRRLQPEKFSLSVTATQDSATPARGPCQALTHARPVSSCSLAQLAPLAIEPHPRHRARAGSALNLHSIQGSLDVFCFPRSQSFEIAQLPDPK